jgi:hypothetical protein
MLYASCNTTKNPFYLYSILLVKLMYRQSSLTVKIKSVTISIVSNEQCTVTIQSFYRQEYYIVSFPILHLADVYLPILTKVTMRCK